MAIFNWRSSRRNFLAGGSVSSALAGLAPQRLLASLEGLTGTPAATANIYERLGVRTRINAKGTYTNLTGSLLPPEVARAMEDAAQHYVVLDELQRAVGERIARMLGVEAACVAPGAAGGGGGGTRARPPGEDPGKSNSS